MENLTESNPFEASQWTGDLSTVSEILSAINSTVEMEEAQSNCLQKYPQVRSWMLNIQCNILLSLTNQPTTERTNEQNQKQQQQKQNSSKSSPTMLQNQRKIYSISSISILNSNTNIHFWFHKIFTFARKNDKHEKFIKKDEKRSLTLTNMITKKINNGRAGVCSVGRVSEWASEQKKMKIVLAELASGGDGGGDGRNGHIKWYFQQQQKIHRRKQKCWSGKKKANI